MLTVPEAARRAELDPETIRRWIHAGRLAARKVGAQYMIEDEDLAAAIRGESPRTSATPGRRVGETTTPYGVGEAVEGERRLTVPEVARRARRNPETVRRWLREGKLPATRVGTQWLIDEWELAVFLGESSDTMPLPESWRRTFWGGPMPDVVGAVRRSRQEH